MKLLHTHGRLVGFSHKRRTRYPHKPDLVTTCPHIVRKLYIRAEMRAGHVPGSAECKAMHDREHAAWRERNGLPPLSLVIEEDPPPQAWMTDRDQAIIAMIGDDDGAS